MRSQLKCGRGGSHGWGGARGPTGSGGADGAAWQTASRHRHINGQSMLMCTKLIKTGLLPPKQNYVDGQAEGGWRWQPASSLLHFPAARETGSEIRLQLPMMYICWSADAAPTQLAALYAVVWLSSQRGRDKHPAFATLLPSSHPHAAPCAQNRRSSSARTRSESSKGASRSSRPRPNVGDLPSCFRP